MTSLAHNTNNDTRLSDLMTEVREFGRESAEGKDALPKLALRVVRAAADGVLTLDKDKDGLDDAARVYDEYAKAESKKAVHDHTANGKKANVSKLRSLVKMGAMTTCDPVDVLNRAHVARQAMIAADEKVRPAYAAFVTIAREQLDKDVDLDDDTLKACIVKPATKSRELEQELESIQKRLEKLISGENSSGLKDQSPEVIEAHSLIGTRLAALIRKSDEEAALAKLREIGYDIHINSDGVPERSEEVTHQGNDTDEMSVDEIARELEAA